MLCLDEATNPETALLQLPTHTYLRLGRAGSGEDEEEKGDGGGVGETRHVFSVVVARVERLCVVWGRGRA